MPRSPDEESAIEPAAIIISPEKQAACFRLVLHRAVQMEALTKEEAKEFYLEHVGKILLPQTIDLRHDAEKTPPLYLQEAVKQLE